MDAKACQDLAFEELKRLFPDREVKAPRVFTDTTDFYAINSGDVVSLGPKLRFLVGNNAREGRFGLDDEVKHWVKRARNLVTGERNILKLVFYERFTANVGGLGIECFRSPGKEARILDMTRGDPAFMQGYPVKDEVGNLVRVLDVIAGKNLQDEILAVEGNHERYFHEVFPFVIRRFKGSVEAIARLHAAGEKHGDVRRDHILVEACTGLYRWIDFDYNFLHLESIYGLDVFGLGNILIFLAGKGDVVVGDLKARQPELFGTLFWEDTSVVWPNRVANLKKVYPYIPDSLNRILRQFSNEASLTYQHAGEMLGDLGEAEADLPLPEVTP